MRKYIDELGIKYDDTPQGFCPNDLRQDKWEKERELYGFDSRETWCLDYAFKLWLYERLCMYDDINMVDTSMHKFEYKGETITFQTCIDRMIKGLKLDLTMEDWDDNKFNNKEIKDSIEDVLPVFALCSWCLWW